MINAPSTCLNSHATSAPPAPGLLLADDSQSYFWVPKELMIPGKNIKQARWLSFRGTLLGNQWTWISERL